MPLQILRSETWALAAAIIQSDIDMLNEPESLGENEPSIGDYGNVTLCGSLRKTITFADIETSQIDLEAQRGTPGAFENFRERFSLFFHSLLQQQDSGFPSESEKLPVQDPIPVTQDERVRFMPAVFLHHSANFTLACQITECHFLKSYYDSLVDWKLRIDYLRCNPSFHGRPRFDCVIVYRGDGHYFARLLYLFIYTFQGTPYLVLKGPVLRTG